MKLIELLRKGLGFVLLSMGVSRPAPRPQPVAAQAGDRKKSLKD